MIFNQQYLVNISTATAARLYFRAASIQLMGGNNVDGRFYMVIFLHFCDSRQITQIRMTEL
jgi:hypothetical protein